MREDIFVIDKDKILNYSNGMIDLAQEMISMFWSDETQNDFNFVNSNISDDDKTNEILDIIHKLKTSVAMLGLTNFYEELEPSYRSMYEKINVSENREKIKELFSMYDAKKDDLRKQYALISFD